MNFSKIYLKSVSEPPQNEVVFVAEKNGIFPCIVLNGQYLAENGRLSNFWEWINLVTGKKTSGYGAFFLPVTVNEDTEVIQ